MLPQMLRLPLSRSFTPVTRSVTTATAFCLTRRSLSINPPLFESKVDSKESFNDAKFRCKDSLAKKQTVTQPVKLSYHPNKSGQGASITFALDSKMMKALKKTAGGSKPSAKAKAQASRALIQQVVEQISADEDSSSLSSSSFPSSSTTDSTTSSPFKSKDKLSPSSLSSASLRAATAIQSHPHYTFGETFAWATAHSYDFSALVNSGRLPQDSEVLEDEEAIFVPNWPPISSSSRTEAKSSPFPSTTTTATTASGSGQVFIFRSGSYVTWGLNEEQSKRFLRSVIQGRDTQHVVEHGRYPEAGDEAMEYLYAPHQTTRIQGDMIVLGQPPRSLDEESSESSSSSSPSNINNGAKESTDLAEWTPTLARLAFSQGLARSARLSVQESALSQFLHSVASIPTQLERSGKVPLTRKQVIQQMGTLLSLRQRANLDRDNFYDEPEVYWENSKLEEHYRLICTELDVSSRFETLNEKLDHCENLLGLVRALLTETSTHRMELVIIALIAFEVGIALLSHGWIPTSLDHPLIQWWSSSSSIHLEATDSASSSSSLL